MNWSMNGTPVNHYNTVRKIQASKEKSTFHRLCGSGCFSISKQTISTYLFMLHFIEDCIENINNTELK